MQKIIVLQAKKQVMINIFRGKVSKVDNYYIAYVYDPNEKTAEKPKKQAKKQEN